jgi:poly(3-hydroxybutyrate) depolymerase
MKTRFHRSIEPLFLAFSCGNLFEQDAASTERFKQLDTHGNGKLTAGDHTRTLRVGKLERRYRVYIPKKYDASKATPVIVVFHGGGGNPESMIRLTGMNAKADEAGFLVVYPFGTGKLANTLLTFNGGECCGYAMDNNMDDVGFTRELLDDLAKVAKRTAKWYSSKSKAAVILGPGRNRSSRSLANRPWISLQTT